MPTKWDEGAPRIEGTMKRDDVQQPFSRNTLFRAAGLLVGLVLMAVLYVSRSKTPSDEVRLIIQAATLTAITVVAIIVVPWERLPGSLQATPPLVFLLVAVLAREATGGADSSYSQLVLLPIVWLGVYGSTAELLAGLFGVAVALTLPLVVPDATASEWRRTIFLIGSATVLGFALQIFFAQLRAHTGKLSQLAMTDDLTGVPNRRSWDIGLERALAESAHTHRPVCVAIIDVDRFKDYNDEFGHQAGDRFLKELTAKWRGQLRESDLMARLGGDEFALVLPSCAAESALTVVRRLCSGIREDRTCSAGVAAWDGRESRYQLVARADASLYEAKEAGRGRVLVAGLTDSA